MTYDLPHLLLYLHDFSRFLLAVFVPRLERGIRALPTLSTG